MNYVLVAGYLCIVASIILGVIIAKKNNNTESNEKVPLWISAFLFPFVATFIFFILGMIGDSMWIAMQHIYSIFFS